MLYSSVNDNIEHIAVHYSIMTDSATAYCCFDCINCTAVDGWKKCTKVMTVATVALSAE